MCIRDRYCYTVTSVNPAGRESDNHSAEQCSSTLPPSPIGLSVTADPSGVLSGGQITNAVYVHMVPMWWVSGFQFDLSFDSDKVAAVAQALSNNEFSNNQFVD